MCHRQLSLSSCLALVICMLPLFVTPSWARNEQVLYSFRGAPDGQWPTAGLVSDRSGNLYSTTAYGGLGLCRDSDQNIVGCGEVFELSPDGSGGWYETVLYSFAGGNDGWYPLAGLAQDKAGNLYGTTAWGGPNMAGTVFELSRDGHGDWKETVLTSFGGANRAGNSPWSGLTFDKQGNFYGTTTGGGEHSSGTVFEFVRSKKGHWSERVLYNFTQEDGGGLQSGYLALDGEGNLYGAAYYGGKNNNGTVYRIAHNRKGGWKESILYAFAGGYDGDNPAAGVILDSKNNVYGTTLLGGHGEVGLVFELSFRKGIWVKRTVHEFTYFTNYDGWGPEADLVFDKAETHLFGTTSWGGTGSCEDGYGDLIGCGMVFELGYERKTDTWTERVLRSFRESGNDGGYPVSGLIWSRAGELYGTTADGGGTECFGIDGYGSGCGTVYKIKP